MALKLAEDHQAEPQAESMQTDLTCIDSWSMPAPFLPINCVSSHTLNTNPFDKIGRTIELQPKCVAERGQKLFYNMGEKPDASKTKDFRHQICIAAGKIEIEVLVLHLLDGSLCRFSDRFYAGWPPRRRRAA
jgi:hypothetical protein